MGKYFRCEKCGAEFTEKEIVWQRIFDGNEIEAPEDVMRCPNCNADGNNYFEEVFTIDEDEENEDGI